MQLPLRVLSFVCALTVHRSAVRLIRCSRSIAADGCEMTIYHVLADRTGTSEARALAEQLAAWHDAMVKHLRVIRSRATAQCAEDCPHAEAGALWSAAQHILGVGAGQLEFLRSHGQRRAASTSPSAHNQVAEMSR
jgi:hypothetical protein